MPLPDWLKQQDETPPPAPAPEPEPEPAAPAPEPVAPAPEPVAPAPEPVAPAPEPVAPAPEPVAPAPEPVAPAPEPVAPAPEATPQPAADPEPVAETAPVPEPEPEPEPGPGPEPEPEPVPEPVAAEPVAAAPEPATAVEIADAPEEAPESSNPADVLDVLAEIEKQLNRIGEFHIVQGPAGETPASTEDADDRPTMADLEEREAELHAMRKRVSELETQIAESSTEQSEQAVAMQTKLKESAKEIKAQGAAVEEAHAQITALQNELATATQALGDAQEALDQASTTPEPAPAPEAAPETAPEAAAGAGPELVEQQRKQIERLTEQLSSLQSGAEPEEIRERDDRIAELEEQLARMGATGGKVSKLVAGFGDALSKVRAKGGKKGDDGGASSALEFRLREVTEESEQLREELKEARQEAHDLRLEVETSGSGAAVPATGEQDKTQIAALRSRVTQLEDELEAVSDGDETGHAAVLQQRIARLEQELAAARVGDKQGELHAQQAKELREQWKQLREERASADRTESFAPQGSRRQQALIVMTCLLLLLGVAAVASMMAADRFLPATVTASVDIEGQGHRGGAVTDEAADAWEAWHRETLADAAFHGKVAQRLAEQRLEALSDPKDVGKRLDDLALYAPKPGALRLTLDGTDRNALTALLDTVATTLAQESSRTVTTRKDAAVAVVHGERHEGGRVRYATLNPEPVKDHRLVAALFFFVIGVVVAVFLFRWVQAAMTRAKAALNDNDFEIVAADV